MSLLFWCFGNVILRFTHNCINHRYEAQERNHGSYLNATEAENIRIVGLFC